MEKPQPGNSALKVIVVHCLVVMLAFASYKGHACCIHLLQKDGITVGIQQR